MMDSAGSLSLPAHAPFPYRGAFDLALRRWARERPDAVAVADAPDRPRLGLGAARRLTFAGLDAAAGRLACNLAALGLRQGQTIAVQMPNVVETIVVILAAWRAGLIVSPLPLAWRLSEIDRAFAQVAPEAVVTIARAAGHEHAATACQAAADHLSVRFVLAFGDALPDGVTAIGSWLEDRLPGALDEPPAFPGAEAAAVMTWGGSPSGPYPVPRSHAALLLLGRVFAQALDLSGEDAVLCPYPMATITGLGGLAMPSLLMGARLVLHQPFDPDVFLDQVENETITHAALPAPMLDLLHRGGQLEGRARRLARIGCVWPAPHGPEPRALTLSPATVFDIHNVGELALAPVQREADGQPALLPLGPVRPAGAGDEGSAFLTTRVRTMTGDGGAPAGPAEGELLVAGPAGPLTGLAAAGPLAAALLQPDADGFIRTRLGCTLEGAAKDRVRCQRSSELIYHGGTAIAAHELDDLYAGYGDFLDAAALAVTDPVMGDRLIAAVVPRPQAILSLQSFRRFLAARQVAAYKLPEMLVVVRTIPRAPDGKVVRERILDQLG